MRRNTNASSSSFAKTVGSHAEVFHGTAAHTSGGLKKKDLVKNPQGRIVSRKKRALGLKQYRRNPAALDNYRAPAFR